VPQLQCLTAEGAHHFDLLDIQRVLGHSDPATTMRSHPEPMATDVLDRATIFPDGVRTPRPSRRLGARDDRSLRLVCASAHRRSYAAAMDLVEFLGQPLVARLAVRGTEGQPTVRPVWFLYEDGCFWWLTGSSYSRLGSLLDADSRVSLVVDTCDLATGQVLAVTASGQAAVRPFDAARTLRKLTKYLGPDRDRWPDRFQGTFTDPTTRLVELRPDRALTLRDLSF
jgi:nitroimidazol reductase NimA-like FMN-containing flavoprotein (pyridoxamine 5'-phosphate oxidase superfamily)